MFRFINQPRIITTKTTNPFINIAFEEWLWDSSIKEKKEEPLLYLWRNEPSVIIGRHQNPFKECFVQKMEEDNVHLVRRFSGGGAVYQDFGNSIFSFMSHNNFYDVKRNMAILCDALTPFGIDALPTGRNDLHVNDHKISGSAFKYASQRGLHHGTILLNLNFSDMAKYLNPNKKKLESKGIKSVVSRVLNLNDICPSLSHESLCDSLVSSFLSSYGLERKEVEFIEIGDDIIKNGEVKQIYDKLLEWNWRFGHSPPFTHNMEERFEWGIMDVNITSKDGLILDVLIYSDSLFPDLVSLIMEHLKNKSYSREGVIKAMDEIRERIRENERDWKENEPLVPADPCLGQLMEFQNWLVQEL